MKNKTYEQQVCSSRYNSLEPIITHSKTIPEVITEITGDDRGNGVDQKAKLVLISTEENVHVIGCDKKEVEQTALAIFHAMERAGVHMIK